MEQPDLPNHVQFVQELLDKQALEKSTTRKNISSGEDAFTHANAFVEEEA